MKLAMIGLGGMGANIARRLICKGRALFARWRSCVVTTFGDELLFPRRFGIGRHVEVPQ